MNEAGKLLDILNIDLTQYSAERDAEIAEMERKWAEREKIERYKRQSPKRYWNEKLETYNAKTESQIKAKTAAQDFISAVDCGIFCSLIFIGKVGTGKTHLALSIIRECGGLYRLSSNIVEELRRAKSFTAKESEAEILENYGNARLLVIDEIGRGVAGAEEQYMLYQIINERYNRRKPTILISNQTKKDFLNYIGIAAADRLTESAQVVEFTWQSYRAVIRRDGGLNEARTAGV